MPLPLAPFEYYMLADDRPDYPMTMCCRTTYTGVFDRPSFARALKRAILRHPLLHATIRKSGWGRLEWVDVPDPEPLITYGRLDAPYEFPRGRHIDLFREIGVRVSIREDGEHSELLLQISHVCCDGLACIQFLEDVLLEYHNERCPDAKLQVREIDASRVTERGKFGLTPLGLLRRAHLELLGLLGAIEFTLHQPLPIAIPAPSSGSSETCTGEFPAMLGHCFDNDEVKALRAVAKQEEDDVTLNDVLVRDLFLALGEWTEQHEPANRGRVLRVMVPTNLREDEDKTSPAANIMSMVNLDRRPTKFGNPQKLLRSLAWEMRTIRKYRLGLTLIHLTRLLLKLRINLSMMLPNRCLATTVISNVSKFPSFAPLPRKNGRTIAGDVAVEMFDGLVVYRAFTRATFLVSFYRGAMSLTMSYDATKLTAEAARQLFDCVLGRIRRTAATEPAEALVHSS